MNKFNKPIKSPTYERGSVLIIGLIFLVVMTMIGTTAMRTTTLEEKMTGNARDRNLAFQATEAALREGEAWLSSKNRNSKPTPCTGVSCEVWDRSVYMTEDLSKKDSSWWGTKAREYETDSTALDDVIYGRPRYLIQEIADASATGSLAASRNGILLRSYYYSVTARGVGGTNTAEVVLESVFTRPY